MVKIILLIGSGSFLGGILRFLGSRFVQNHFSTSFPMGTFTVNILGSLLIGIFYGLAERGNLLTNEMRIFLTIGFCGGFTTFSTFTHENIVLLKDGNFLFFSLYAGLSVFLGLMATYLGNLLTKIG